jgi:hypothetical protein
LLRLGAGEIASLEPKNSVLICITVTKKARSGIIGGVGIIDRDTNNVNSWGVFAGNTIFGRNHAERVGRLYIEVL